MHKRIFFGILAVVLSVLASPASAFPIVLSGFSVYDGAMGYGTTGDVELTVTNVSITNSNSGPAAPLLVLSTDGNITASLSGGTFTNGNDAPNAYAFGLATSGASSITIDNSIDMIVTGANASRNLLAYNYDAGSGSSGNITINNSANLTNTNSGVNITAATGSGDIVINNSGNLTAAGGQNIVAFSTGNVTVNSSGNLMNSGGSYTGTIQAVALGTGTATVNMTGGSIHSGGSCIVVGNNSGSMSLSDVGLTVSGSGTGSLSVNTAAGTSLISDNGVGISVGNGGIFGDGSITGGTAAMGTTITVNSQSNITAGSWGILAQSINDATVSVTQTGGSIVASTGGDGSYGIFAGSAGIVSVTNSASITANGNDIAAGSNFSSLTTAGSVTVNNSGAILSQYEVGISAGISNNVSSPVVGDVTVTNSGSIRTFASGNSARGPAPGIAAQQFSYTGSPLGNITVVNNVGGNITTSGNMSAGIDAEITSYATGNAGAIHVANAATITTLGADAPGIYTFYNDAVQTGVGPINIANSGTIIAQGGETFDPMSGLLPASDGIDALTNSGSAVNIDNSGIISVQGNGILATGLTVGNTGNLLISNEGNILGGTAGIAVTGYFSDVTINNSGDVGSLNDLAIDTRALSTDHPTVNNSGTILGYVLLGDSANTMNNSGLWNLRNYNTTTGGLAVAMADFGNSGANVINNTGTIALLGAAGATVDATGQYVPLAPGTVVNAAVNNPFNAMSAGGPVQGQILGVQTFNNAGVIDLTANPVLGNVLIISGGHTPGTDGGGVFVANGGQLRVDSLLNEGGLNSQSDVLVVDSTKLGSAPTAVMVTYGKSGGAITTGDGIAVIEVLNKAASDPGAFALGRRVAAGAYDYNLYHNGVGADAADGNWYIRTEGIRPEVPIDTIVPALASRMGLAMMGSLGNRNGGFFDPPGQCDCGGGMDEHGYGNQLWARMFGEAGGFGSNTGSSNLSFSGSGPSYTFDFGGVQAGDDLFAHSERNQAGLYVVATTLRSNVVQYNNLPAGWITMDAYGVGAYWTHRDPNGWYSDLVLALNGYENIRTQSSKGVSFNTNGWGLLTSGEMGYIFSYTNGYSFVPQGQLVYQRTNIDNGSDDYGKINYGASNEVYGRMGVRFAKGWFDADTNVRRFTAYLEGNIWHQFTEDSVKTTFSSLQGDYPTVLAAGLMGTWAEIGLGFSGQVAKNVGLFGSINYNMEMSHTGHSLGGQVGAQIGW